MAFPSLSPVGPSRRERVRTATETEIKATARRLLVEEGVEALTLRAIARDMGMSAPALYRYFDSHEALMEAVVQDLLDELVDVLQAARDAEPADDPAAQMRAACRAFRRWSLDHPREFQLTFASNVPHRHDSLGALTLDGVVPADVDICDRLSFGMVFLEIFQKLWRQNQFPVLPDEALDPRLAEQLRAFCLAMPVDMPLGALAAFLSGWVELYGAVTVEVFGHLGFALVDAEPLFELRLAEMAQKVAHAVATGDA